MKIVIETMVTVFFMTIMIFLSVQLIATSCQMSDAKSYYNQMIRRVEDSQFDRDIIESYKLEARNMGYMIEIELQEVEMLPKAIVNFLYSIEIPLLGIDHTECLTGYIG